jgi:RNA polymerase sigma-70 factor (ECF subfamily)
MMAEPLDPQAPGAPPAPGVRREPTAGGAARERPRLERLSDAECVVLARQGPSSAAARSAADELVRRYTPGIYHLALRLLGDRGEAEDATQEIFLRAARALGEFRLSESFKAWIHTIAWNHARDCLRRRKRLAWLRPRPIDARQPEEDREVFEPPDARAEAPDDRLLALERRELVERALSTLDPRERGLLVLREFEGLSQEELVEILGCPLGTVKSSLFRARARLKDAILRLCPELRRRP